MQSIDAILKVADRIFSVISVMLSLVGGIALFVACVGITNTMIMAIYERTREIGTLKAMGASKSDIRQMFMIEAGLIGLFGGALGVVLSFPAGPRFEPRGDLVCRESRFADARRVIRHHASFSVAGAGIRAVNRRFGGFVSGQSRGEVRPAVGVAAGVIPNPFRAEHGWP